MDAAAQALTPTLSQSTGRGSKILWTAVGVGALVLAGIAIRAAGEAAGLKNDACWQLTGARAAASTAVLGTLVSLRRGQLALFGALYGVWLMAMHSNSLLVGSAVLAGIGAWMIGVALSDRGLVVRLLVTTMAFNVLLTTSGLIKAISGDAVSRVTLGSWASGVGLRVLATLAVVGVFAIFATKRSAADERR